MLRLKKRGGFFEVLAHAQSTNTPITDKNILKAIDEHVGRQFKTARYFRGIKLVSLAKEMRISYQQLQKNQRGDDRMPASRMYQIASLLKMPPAFFFDGLPLIKTEPLPKLKKEHFELLRHYDALPEKARKDVLRFIKVMGRSDE